MPKVEFNLNDTKIGKLYALYGSARLVKYAYKVYTLTTPKGVANLGLSAAQPLSQFLGSEKVADATGYTVLAASLVLNPWSTLASTSMQWLTGMLLNYSWENLPPEYQESQSIKELYALAHILKNESIAKVATKIELKLTEPSLQQAPIPTQTPVQAEPPKSVQSDGIPLSDKKIDDLKKNGWKFYRHWDGNTHGAHMSNPADAKNYLSSNPTYLIEAKKRHGDSIFIGYTPPANSQPVSQPQPPSTPQPSAPVPQKPPKPTDTTTGSVWRFFNLFSHHHAKEKEAQIAEQEKIIQQGQLLERNEELQKLKQQSLVHRRLELEKLKAERLVAKGINLQTVQHMSQQIRRESEARIQRRANLNLDRFGQFRRAVSNRVDKAQAFVRNLVNRNG